MLNVAPSHDYDDEISLSEVANRRYSGAEFLNGAGSLFGSHLKPRMLHPFIRADKSRVAEIDV